MAFFRLVSQHYEEFERIYPEKYADTYGYFRPVISDVVRKYLVCGDLREGFARVRCDDCGHEYLLSFSCKGRYFCTSCHTKRAVAFSEWLNDTVLWAVPHRQIVLTVQKMLRPHADHCLHRGRCGRLEDPGAPEALGGAGAATTAD